jgi:hypothetical protein
MVKRIQVIRLNVTCLHICINEESYLHCLGNYTYVGILVNLHLPELYLELYYHQVMMVGLTHYNNEMKENFTPMRISNAYYTHAFNNLKESKISCGVRYKIKE